MRERFSSKYVLGMVLGGLFLMGLVGPASVLGQSGSPGRSGFLTTWVVPTPDPGLSALDFGLGGEVYFTEFNRGKIGRLDPLSNSITEWTVGLGPRRLTVYAGGAVLYTDDPANRIGMLIPQMDNYATEMIPTAGARPYDLFAQAIGLLPLEVWFTERASGRLGVLTVEGFVFDALLSTMPTSQTVTPTTGVITSTVQIAAVQFTPGNPALPPPIALAPSTVNGPFTEWEVLVGAGGAQLSALAPNPTGGFWLATETSSLLGFDGGNVTHYSLPAGSASNAVAVDSSDNVWYTGGYTNRIGQLNPLTGDVTEWLLPTAQVFDLAIDPSDGSVWFTDREGDRVGRLDPTSGEVELFQLPADTHPLSIEMNADGVWFVSERLGTIHNLSFSMLGQPPTPPSPVGLPTITLSIDRGYGVNYNPGDTLTINISVSETAAVTLLDFETNQNIKQIPLGTIAPGTTRTVSGVVGGPSGVETLVAVARTATVTLQSQLSGEATLFNVTRTGQIKQLLLGQPIQAGVALQLTAPIDPITGRSTLVAYVHDTVGRNLTAWCSMNVLP